MTTVALARAESIMLVRDGLRARLQTAEPAGRSGLNSGITQPPLRSALWRRNRSSKAVETLGSDTARPTARCRVTTWAEVRRRAASNTELMAPSATISRMQQKPPERYGPVAARPTGPRPCGHCRLQHAIRLVAVSSRHGAPAAHSSAPVRRRLRRGQLERLQLRNVL